MSEIAHVLNKMTCQKNNVGISTNGTITWDNFSLNGKTNFADKFNSTRPVPANYERKVKIDINVLAPEFAHLISTDSNDNSYLLIDFVKDMLEYMDLVNLNTVDVSINSSMTHEIGDKQNIIGTIVIKGKPLSVEMKNINLFDKFQTLADKFIKHCWKWFDFNKIEYADAFYVSLNNLCRAVEVMRFNEYVGGNFRYPHRHAIYNNVSLVLNNFNVIAYDGFIMEGKTAAVLKHLQELRDTCKYYYNPADWFDFDPSSPNFSCNYSVNDAPCFENFIESRSDVDALKKHTTVAENHIVFFQALEDHNIKIFKIMHSYFVDPHCLDTEQDVFYRMFLDKTNDRIPQSYIPVFAAFFHTLSNLSTNLNYIPQNRSFVSHKVFRDLGKHAVSNSFINNGMFTKSGEKNCAPYTFDNDDDGEHPEMDFEQYILSFYARFSMVTTYDIILYNHPIKVGSCNSCQVPKPFKAYREMESKLYPDHDYLERFCFNFYRLFVASFYQTFESVHSAGREPLQFPYYFSLIDPSESKLLDYDQLKLSIIEDSIYNAKQEFKPLSDPNTCPVHINTGLWSKFHSSNETLFDVKCSYCGYTKNELCENENCKICNEKCDACPNLHERRLIKQCNIDNI
jgi:hypothetical protein